MKDDDKVHHQCVFDGTLKNKGWDVFRHMLTMTKEELGYCLPDLPTFSVDPLSITEYMAGTWIQF